MSTDFFFFRLFFLGGGGVGAFRMTVEKAVIRCQSKQQLIKSDNLSATCSLGQPLEPSLFLNLL